MSVDNLWTNCGKTIEMRGGQKRVWKGDSKHGDGCASGARLVVRAIVSDLLPIDTAILRLKSCYRLG